MRGNESEWSARASFPALGYKSEAQQGIPANSTLVFVIDLLKIS